MVPKHNLFTTYHSLPPNSRNVIVGSGDTLQAIGIGTITVKGKKGEVLNVKGVLHVPGLAANLLSCSQLARQEYICTFTTGWCTVCKGGVVVMEAKLEKGLYIVPVCLPHVEKAHGVEAEDAACSTRWRDMEQVTADLLHLRMGHAGRQQLVECVKKGELKCVEIKEGGGQPIKCPDCTTGKLPRTSFPTSTTRASAPLELVHTDVCGPMQTSDREKGNKYFITFLYDFSRLSWVTLVKTKDEVVKVFKRWIRFAEREAGAKVKILRSDRAIGIGTITIKGKEGGVLHVKGVLHVPGLATNLLSCSQLARQDYICTFTIGGCTVRKGGAMHPLEGCGAGDGRFAAPTHGACGKSIAYGVLKKGELKGVEIKEGGGQPSKCPDCITGKLPRTCFPTSTTRVSASLELVHTDVCGPMQTPDREKGSKYFITFLYDFSCLSWVTLVKTKDEVAKVFKRWIRYAEREAGAKVKILRSDWGGEYMGKDMESFLEDKGITHQLSVAYTPQQNGAAERLNRTLIEIKTFPETATSEVPALHRPLRDLKEIPLTLLLWLSLSASHWRGSLGQQLEQHLGQQLGELYRFTDKLSRSLTGRLWSSPAVPTILPICPARVLLLSSLNNFECTCPPRVFLPSSSTAHLLLARHPLLVFTILAYPLPEPPTSLQPGDSPRRRLERFQSDETPILQSLPTSAIRAVKSAGSSSDRSRGGATKEDGASAAAAGFPSSPFPRVFESGQGSCGFPDTRADADECVADLAEFPALSARSGSATVRKLACLAHNYLRPWMGIPGVTAGMGARGMISAEILHQMGTMANQHYLPSIHPPSSAPPTTVFPALPPLSPFPPLPNPPSLPTPFLIPISSLPSPTAPFKSILSCSGHIRIVRGKVFFRLGAFQFDWYRMRRFVFTVKMIQDAISAYKLYNLNAELFINTCDLPTSKADSVARADRAGMPLFSPHVVPGSLDIPYPDPVDLSKSYFRDVEDKVSWEQKQGRAVFRGGMTNYHIAMPMHWRSSPRFRVHRMADARPDLLDARVMSGVDVRWRKSMEEDGVRLGGRLKPEELQGFKYELDVDGGTGSGRTCGILASNQVFKWSHFGFLL
ncbi:unnamed protein product [Closterium sp. NIES-54]